MSQPVAVVLMLSVAAIILTLMLWGWSRRRHRDSGISAPRDLRTEAEIAVHGGYRATGLYVASTVHGAPLDRLAIAGLAFRAKSDIIVSPAGVALHLAGEHPVLIAPQALVAVDRATWVVGRIVEPNGLVLISWRTEVGTTVDSYLRLHDAEPTVLIAEIAALVSKHHSLPASSSTESTE